MNRKNMLLSLMILVLCAGCGSMGQTPAPDAKQAITVELDVYSGRPNPWWTLSPQETTELSARLQGLAALASVPVVDHLGYRGFLLHTAGKQPDSAAEIRVYKGVIIITDQGSTSAYADSKGLEQWLVTLARAQGQGQTLQAIGF